MLKESKVFLSTIKGHAPTIFKVTRVGLDWTGLVAWQHPLPH